MKGYPSLFELSGCHDAITLDVECFESRNVSSTNNHWWTQRLEIHAPGPISFRPEDMCCATLTWYTQRVHEAPNPPKVIKSNIYIYSRSNHDLERSTVYTSTPTPKRRFLLSFGTRWVLIIHQRCASPTIAVPVLNNGTNPYSPRSVQSCVAPGEKLLTPNSACSMLPLSLIHI